MNIGHSYYATNTASGYFTFNSGYTASSPLSGTNGYSFASYLLGYSASGSANEPAYPNGQQRYRTVYFGETWQVTNRLTLNLGCSLRRASASPGRSGKIPWSAADTELFRIPELAVGGALKPSSDPANSASTAFVSSLDGGITPIGTLNNSFPSGLQQQTESLDRECRAKPGDRGAWRRYRRVTDCTKRVHAAVEPGCSAAVAGRIFRRCRLAARGATPVEPRGQDLVRERGARRKPTRVVCDDAQQSYRAKSCPPKGLRRRPVPASSHLLSNVSHCLRRCSSPAPGRRSQRGPRELRPGLPAAAKGTRLGYTQVMNQLPDALPGPGSALLTQVPNLFYGLIQFGHLSSSALAARQLLLPFPQYSTVNVSGTGYGTSSYQSFQAKFEKHLAQGGTLLVSYTFAKLLSDADTALGQTESGTGDVAAVQDWNNIRGSNSLASQNYRETPKPGYRVGSIRPALLSRPPLLLETSRALILRSECKGSAISTSCCSRTRRSDPNRNWGWNSGRRYSICSISRSSGRPGKHLEPRSSG